MIDGAVNQKSSNYGWLMSTPVGAWAKVIFRYALFNQANFRKLLTDVYQKEVPQEAVDGYLAPVLTKGTLNGLVQFVKTSKNVMIQDVKSLNLKINLMWGQKDTWIPIEAMDEIKSTVTVSKTIIFPSAGHTPHETEADFNQALLGIIE
jgi:pimeloyl-ACP methyl ester carboxylesterase